jgi:ribonuclease HIII
VKVDATRLEQLHQLLLRESQSELKITNKYEAFRIAFPDGLMIAYNTGKVVVSGEKSLAVLGKVLAQMGLEVI